MNYLILIFAVVVGIALGVYFIQRKDIGLISKQSKTKAKNIEKVLDFVRENGKIKNDDVEKLVGVSNATAERYLNELEKQGKIEQHGVIGQNVFYTLK